MTKVDTKKYLEFVYTVTSAPSTDPRILEARLRELDANGADVSKLLTAALGLTAESGEFTEVRRKSSCKVNPTMKKMFFT